MADVPLPHLISSGYSCSHRPVGVHGGNPLPQKSCCSYLQNLAILGAKNEGNGGMSYPQDLLISCHNGGMTKRNGKYIRSRRIISFPHFSKLIIQSSWRTNSSQLAQVAPAAKQQRHCNSHHLLAFRWKLDIVSATVETPVPWRTRSVPIGCVLGSCWSILPSKVHSQDETC